MRGRRTGGTVRRDLMLAVALGLASSPPASAQQEASWLFGDVGFPVQVGDFEAVGAEVVSDGATSTILRYRSRSFRGVLVEVQVRPLTDGRADPEAIRGELTRTLGELAGLSRGLERTSVTVDTVRTASVEAGGWTYAGHRAEATMRAPDGTRRIYAYVFAKPPSFVRVRATFVPADRSTLEPALDTFLTGLLGRIESFQGSRPTGGG